MINRNIKIFFSPNFKTPKKPEKIKVSRKFSKSQRKIKPIADKIISSYGKENPNLHNFVAEELVNEDIYKNFDQALNDCKIVLDEIDAGSQLAIEIENIQSEKKRINDWFRDFYNLGFTLQKIEKNKNYFILIVVPSLKFVSSIVATGYCTSYLSSMNAGEKNIDLSLQDYLDDEQSTDDFFIYKKSNKELPIFAQYQGIYRYSIENTFNSKDETNMYRFLVDRKTKGYIHVLEKNIHKEIGFIDKGTATKLLEPGAKVPKPSNGLEVFFFQGNGNKLMSNSALKLCRMYGITGHIYEDIYRTKFQIEDTANEKRYDGTLNDILHANIIGNYDVYNTEIISPRSKTSDSGDGDNIDLIIYNGSESYLKFSSEANDANGIAIISPEDVDFKSAIGKANGDFALSSSNINEESLAYFANKYPSMGYWK